MMNAVPSFIAGEAEDAVFTSDSACFVLKRCGKAYEASLENKKTQGGTIIAGGELQRGFDPWIGRKVTIVFETGMNQVLITTADWHEVAYGEN